MSGNLEQRQELRFEYLKEVYNLSVADTNEFIDHNTVATQIVSGNNKDEVRKAAEYLEGEGLIEISRSMGGLGNIRITHQGIKKAEELT